MSESDRPIDRLLASLLAADGSADASAKEDLGDELGPEELDRVRRAVAAMAKAAEPADPPAGLLQSLRQTLAGPRRLDRFLDALARFYDFTEVDARGLIVASRVYHG